MKKVLIFILCIGCFLVGFFIPKDIFHNFSNIFGSINQSSPVLDKSDYYTYDYDPENFNYKELVNAINLNTVRAVVTIKSSSPFSSTRNKQGTGVLYGVDDNYYYCLTNNHVVYNEESYFKNFEVIDYLGGSHEAFLLKTSLKDDLAILKFSKECLTNFAVLKFADSNPKI